MVGAKPLVDVCLYCVMSLSLKEPSLWEPSLLVSALGHFVTKVALPKYKMRVYQNMKNNQLPKITRKDFSV